MTVKNEINAKKMKDLEMLKTANPFSFSNSTPSNYDLSYHNFIHPKQIQPFGEKKHFNQNALVP